MKSQQDWDEFYMRLTRQIALQSYASDKLVGAIIVKNGNIISYSYNGTPEGWSNDTENDGITLPHVLHAEAQAIIKLARSHESTLGATMYCNFSPCIQCAKLIGESGIKRLVYETEYKDKSGLEHLRIKRVILNNEDCTPRKAPE